MSSSGESECGTYESSSRVSAAWLEAPEAWRTVQLDQLLVDLSELRARADSTVEDAMAPKRTLGRRPAERLAFR